MDYDDDASVTHPAIGLPPRRSCSGPRCSCCEMNGVLVTAATTNQQTNQPCSNFWYSFTAIVCVAQTAWQVFDWLIADMHVIPPVLFVKIKDKGRGARASQGICKVCYAYQAYHDASYAIIMLLAIITLYRPTSRQVNIRCSCLENHRMFYLNCHWLPLNTYNKYIYREREIYAYIIIIYLHWIFAYFF